MDAQALHGNVIVDLDRRTISRNEAIELVRKLASAIQNAGDICDPFAVELVEFLANNPDEGRDVSTEH